MRARFMVLSCKEANFVTPEGKSYDYTRLEVASMEEDGLGAVVQVNGVAGLRFNGYGEYAADFIFVKRDKGFQVRFTNLLPVGAANAQEKIYSQEEFDREMEVRYMTSLMNADTAVPLQPNGAERSALASGKGK